MEKSLNIIGLIFLAVLQLNQPVFAADSATPFILVSDIDDTLKITDVSHKWDMVWNSLFSTRTFVGMPELYSALVRSSLKTGHIFPRKTGPFVLLSGSPTFLQGVLEKSFEGLPLPTPTFRLRDWLRGQSVAQFKREKLEKLRKTVEIPFLLIGDDTEMDPVVLSEFVQAYPGHSLKAYIHVVSGRGLPPGVTRYFTAFDLAVHEFEEGRLEAEDLMLIASRIMDEKRAEDLFPPFTLCPADYAIDQSPLTDQIPELKALKNEVTEYIRNLCSVSR
jgi:hypothetical protein